MAQPAVLIVDDEPINREILVRRLQKEGYRCRTAGDGEQALAEIERELPDLVLLDVMMPRIDGFEVCRRLREKVLTRALPVILVTTLSDSESRAIGLEAGADDFLSKPVDPHELTARVRSLVRLRHFQTLSAQRELMDVAFQGLDVGVLVAEPDGAIVAINRRARHLLNIAEDVAHGLDWQQHLTAFEIVPPLPEALAQRGELPTFDICRRGRPPLVIEAHLTRIVDPDGELVYHALALSDVTTQREDESLRRDFLALVAHKIRTPMTILRGVLDLFADERGAAAASELLPELMPDLIRKVDDIGEIVRELIEQSDQGGQHPRLLTPVKAKVDSVARQALATVLASQPQTSLALACQSSGELPIGDADLLLVLRELFENAAKFGAGEVRLESTALVDSLVLTIADDGLGIPHEHFEKVFEDCFQVDEGFTGQVPGLGLGLGLVRRVLAAYDATIEITASAPQQGTTFRIRLPLG